MQENATEVIVVIPDDTPEEIVKILMGEDVSTELKLSMLESDERLEKLLQGK